jgi:hypothetical protein
VVVALAARIELEQLAPLVFACSAISSVRM